MAKFSEERVCANPKCLATFTARIYNAIHCSTKCTRATYKARNYEKINQTWRESYARNGYEKHILKTYGLTLNEWTEMSKDGCEICHTKDNLVVDHDHVTGAVRGCLCKAHNAGLGSFHDSIEELQNAIKYMESR